MRILVCGNESEVGARAADPDRETARLIPVRYLRVAHWDCFPGHLTITVEPPHDAKIFRLFDWKPAPSVMDRDNPVNDGRYINRIFGQAGKYKSLLRLETAEIRLPMFEAKGYALKGVVWHRVTVDPSGAIRSRIDEKRPSKRAFDIKCGIAAQLGGSIFAVFLVMVKLNRLFVCIHDFIGDAPNRNPTGWKTVGLQTHLNTTQLPLGGPE